MNSAMPQIRLLVKGKLRSGLRKDDFWWHFMNENKNKIGIKYVDIIIDKEIKWKYWLIEVRNIKMLCKFSKSVQVQQKLKVLKYDPDITIDLFGIGNKLISYGTNKVGIHSINYS